MRDRDSVKEMICHKCGKVVLFEKIVVENKVYHYYCWELEN